MLKKSLVLGLLAAFTMAPAAFAGSQTQGNSTVTTIDAGSVGYGNRTNINNRTNVDQSQSSYESGRGRRHSRKCNTGSQVQGNVTDTAISVGNVGNRNNARINNTTNVNQGQSAVCR
ncbi:hypothetical protein NIES4071_01100 [Calothrix sp. NIES-4071]|nr:hypothetical protein NIES4071_01100 [Calothrix sp. NIES-4071]BAZ54456.1 hypothetical protein NIES4105_01090 [Calothrix sp. NIES-4105]